MKSLLLMAIPTVLVAIVSTVLFGCGKKETTAPILERIRKTWVVQQVKENNAVVYVRGASTNIKAGYTQFRLTLTDPTRVTLQDLDGITTAGIYELITDQRLVLKSLMPKPTGTEGQIEFTLTSFSDSQMELTRSSVNLKTGGSTNQYTMVPQ